jgi:uncharacterized protein (TIGR01655 family)
MKSNKKTVLIVVGIVLIALIIAAAFFGRQYYENRYVSENYYAMIPLNYDVTPETMKSDNGDDMGQGKEYKLTIYSTDGKSREVSFTVYAPGSGMAGERELPKPGEYLLVKASKQIVTGWESIDKSQVPDKALEKIEAA